jgi:hypothetical protein
MKLVYGEFFCPECGQIRWLKAKTICVDCRDKILLDKISQSRKTQNAISDQICIQ